MCSQVGRAVSFIGSTAALGIMTLISVLIGNGFKRVPDALKSSVPVGRYLSVACMLYFGVRTLKVGPSLECLQSVQPCPMSLPGSVWGEYLA